MKRLWIGLLGGIVGTVSLIAAVAPPGPADSLIQTERQQQLLRANTEKVSDQLRALIEESQHNDIAGDELQTLQTIAGILTRLTDKDMQRVVDLLQAARSEPAAGPAQRRVVEAFSSQKSILVQMRQLVAEYRHRQELQEIATRFLALADRQGANLNLTVAFAESGKDFAPPQRGEPQRAALAAQTIEQDAIGAEVKIGVSRLETFTKQPANPAITERVNKTRGTIQSSQLLPILDAAVASLKDGQLFNAAGQEKNIRDQLRVLARILTRPTDPVDILQQAATDLDHTIRAQRQVADDAKALQGDDPGKQTVADRQANLVDRTDAIRQATGNLAPTTAGKLNNALNDMQHARSDLQSNHPSQAEQNAHNAADELVDARQALAAELVRAEQSTPTLPAAELRQAEQNLKKLIDDQEKLKHDTAATATRDMKALPTLAPTEAKLQQTAQDLQRATAENSRATAQALAEAAQQMQRAHDNLAKGQNAAPVQQAALDALQQARQQLQPELAQAERDEQAAATLESLLEQLAKIIRDQQQVLFESGKPAAALASLATAQSKVVTATDALQPDVAQLNAEAGTLLSGASQDMKKAKTDLTGQQLTEAQPVEQAALDKLYKVKALLEQQQPPQPADLQAANNAADALTQAQQQVGQALEQLAQAQPDAPSPETGTPGQPSAPASSATSAAMQQAAQALKNVASTVGALAASQKNGLTASAEPAAQAAQQAAAQAAAQAAGNQPVAATASAMVTQAALAQAQAAMAMAAGPQPGQQPGPEQSLEPSLAPMVPGGSGTGNLSNNGANGAVKDGTGPSVYLGLPARDRQAIQQSQGEKYPEEFGPMIEQYLRNLAAQTHQDH